MENCQESRKNKIILYSVFGLVGLQGIATVAFSIACIYKTEASDSEAHSHMIPHFIVAAFIGIVQVVFSSLPLCKITSQSLWKWANFFSGLILTGNVSSGILRNSESLDSYFLAYWIYLSVNAVTLLIATIAFCCRDYRLNAYVVNHSNAKLNA